MNASSSALALVGRILLSAIFIMSGYGKIGNDLACPFDPDYAREIPQRAYDPDKAKFLIKQIRYAILIIFIVAAVITPSADVVTQCIFAAPMLVLYILSIGVAWVFGKAKPKEQV